MRLEESMPAIRRVFRDASRTSLHVSIASVNSDGSPHVTPIGSLYLREDGVGVFFELFTTKLIENIERNPRVSVLAVNSGKWFWLRSLLAGRFPTYPGVRLDGTMSARRESTSEERDWWKRRIAPINWTRGAQILWSDANLKYVREIHFTQAIPVEVGAMTQHLAVVKQLQPAEAPAPLNRTIEAKSGHDPD
jgi:uncharacterized protein